MFQPQLKLIIHLKLLSSLCKQPVIRFFFFIYYFEQSEFEPWLGTLYCDTLHCTLYCDTKRVIKRVIWSQSKITKTIAPSTVN